jgi:hypothetical protein
MLRWLKRSTARRRIVMINDLIGRRRKALKPRIARLTVHGEPFTKIFAFWKLYRKT